jgi:dephospho-CoA kinase
VSSEQHRWVLSGGLAAGKSKVRAFLEAGGVITVDSDRVGHLMLESEGPAFGEVAARWPHVVRDGEIDRHSLASVVFNDPGELAALESITHPHIFDTIRAQVEEVEGPVVVEVPLIGHGLGDTWRRIVVDCRDEIRLARAVERGMSEEDARSRMAAQPSRAEWLAVADLVVPNHGSLEELETAVNLLVSAVRCDPW